jgi:hypothetical protein
MRNLLRSIAVVSLLALPLAASAAVFVSVAIGPPVLPVYAPPPIPGPAYIWAPGYWAWDGAGYYWVPGTWVLAPAPGLLWTPGYWGWSTGLYVWHAGYWGPHVGFYGGINYGFGYGGVGYHGGYWKGATFVSNTTVINEAPVNRVSFNGGAGGVVARPAPIEMKAAEERHLGMSGVQQQHELAAARDNTMRAAFNNGHPPVAATAKPRVFYGKGVVPARVSGNAPPGPHAPYSTHAPNSPPVRPSATPAPYNAVHAPHAGNVGGPPHSGGHPGPAPHGVPANHAPQDRAGEHAPHGGEHSR